MNILIPFASYIPAKTANPWKSTRERYVSRTVFANACRFIHCSTSYIDKPTSSRMNACFWGKLLIYYMQIFESEANVARINTRVVGRAWRAWTNAVCCFSFRHFEYSLSAHLRVLEKPSTNSNSNSLMRFKLIYFCVHTYTYIYMYIRLCSQNNVKVPWTIYCFVCVLYRRPITILVLHIPFLFFFSIP